MMAQIAAHLIRLSIQLVLLPVVAVVVPVVYGLAWLHEACSDLTRRV